MRKIADILSKLKVKNGCLYRIDFGNIKDVAALIRKDIGEVIDIGEYSHLCFILKWSEPINGWDMHVLRISGTADEALWQIKTLAADPELCMKLCYADAPYT